MSCCTNTYDLGCFESCEVITSSITVSVTGPYTIQLLPTLSDLVQFERANGQSLIIPNSFNEIGTSTFRVIDPNGDVFTYTENGVTYDCFKIENKISTTPSLIPVGADCDPATANAINSNSLLLVTQSIASGGIGNLNIPDTPVTGKNSTSAIIVATVNFPSGEAGDMNIPDTPITTKNVAGTIIAGPTNFPSGVAADQTVANFILTIDDQDGVNLNTSSENSGVNITKVVTVDKSTFLKFYFQAGDSLSGTETIINGESEGTYTAETTDGGSGTWTYSINGGAFTAFALLTPLVLVAGDTIQAQRTTPTNAGFTKLTGTFT